MSNSSNESIITSLRTTIVGLLVLLVGILMLYLSQRSGYETNSIWPPLLNQLGSVIIAGVILTLFWELYNKRAFTNELLKKMQLSQNMAHTGLREITKYEHLEWRSYLDKAEKLDVFFAYARTWRSENEHYLKAIVSRKRGRIRAIIADADDKTTVCELARSFAITEDDLRFRLAETLDGLKNLAPKKPKCIQIWVMKLSPRISFYIIDDKIAIISLYSHRKERIQPPVFICEKGGTLFDFVRNEFDTMINTPDRCSPISNA